MAGYHKKIIIIVLLLITAVVVFKTTRMGEALTLANIQQSAATLRNYVEAHYISSVVIFISAYVLFNLWLPAAAVMTLLAGFLFGTVMATIYVDAAAALGAFVGFWLSRHILGNWVQRKWHQQLDGLNRQIDEHGYVYLVLLRMFPLMPYVLINFLAGLTKIRPRTIIWTTAVGSLPGILIFSYAGGQLLTIQSVDDVLTPKTMAAFALMVIFAVTVMIIRHVMWKKKQSFNPAPETS